MLEFHHTIQLARAIFTYLYIYTKEKKNFQHGCAHVIPPARAYDRGRKISTPLLYIDILSLNDIWRMHPYGRFYYSMYRQNTYRIYVDKR